MVELIFAKVQLGLCEDRLDRIPFRAVSLIEYEVDSEPVAELIPDAVVGGEVVGEEGNRNVRMLLAQALCKFDEVFVPRRSVERVDLRYANVKVDGSNRLPERGEGKLLVDEGVGVHPRPVGALVRVLREEDLVHEEKEPALSLGGVKLFDDVLWRVTIPYEIN